MIHRHFTESNRYYLVMDFVEGEDLQTLIERQRGPGLPEAQVLDWAVQLCDILSYLHNQHPPIIFRDLKPANIMLTPSGRVKLVDFGIARLFQATKGTDTVRMGTIGYAAPEQFGGRGQTDARSDIYALGATLYHLLTGRDPSGEPPFQFPPVSALRRDISAYVDLAVAKALAYDRSQRFQTAAEMKQALSGSVPVQATRAHVVSAQVAQGPAAPALPRDVPPARLTTPPATGSPKVIDNIIYGNIAEDNVLDNVAEGES